MSDLQIHYVPIDDLVPAARNARTHSKKQIRQIAKSIEMFGFLNPVLCDGTRRIVAGHGRVDAAKLIAMAAVPVVYANDLTPDQLRLYAIAENRLSELGGFSTEILSLELSELADLDLGCDLTITGFDTAEIDLMLSGPDHNDAADDLASAPPARAQPPMSQVGDLWQVGPHRIICGDARSMDTYAALLGDERAQMIITDPPFNVRVADISGLGKARHPEFEMASGEMSAEQFTGFLRAVIDQLVAFSANGSIHYLFMDYRHMGELLTAGSGAYAELKSLCVWVKSNAGMGSLYRSQHELVFVFKAGSAPHINNVQLGRFGRSRSNVWRYAGMNAFGRGRDEALALHATVKPVDLVSDAILDCSERDGMILDAFLGSGTTLVAAHRTGRRGYGIELDPYYVDAAVQRVSAAVGAPAVHVASGRSFQAICADRAALALGAAR